MKKTQVTVWWLLVVVSFVLSFFMILNAAIPESYDYKEGEISQSDIYAPRDVEDTVSTQRRKENAAAQIKNQYTIDYSVNERTLEDLKAFLTLCQTASQMEGMSVSEKAGYVVADAEFEIDKDTAFTILSMGEQYAEFSKILVEEYTAVMEQGVVEKSAGLTALQLRLLDAGLSNDQSAVGEAVANGFLEVNKSYDAEATEAERQRAMEQIEPTVYKKNQIIVRRGEIVTQDQIQLLTDLGLMSQSQTLNIKYSVGIFLFLLIAYFAVGYYMRRKGRSLEQDIRRMVFTLFVTVITLFVLMLVSDIPSQYVFLVPIPTCAILLSVFVDMGTAVLASSFISFAGTVMLSQNESFAMAMIVFCALAAVAYARASNISGFAIISLIVSTIGAAAFSAFALIDGKSMAGVIRCILYGFINGIASSIVAVGTTPFWEMAFGITTPFKLMELASPEKKLMRRMLFEAPGTYHHSLMVGNLAEAACDRIGADALLARVGSYYHDIGKLKQPEYFKENQIGANLHDNLQPAESARILISHVANGLEIAEKYRLPKEIQDIICRHHGTSTAGTFYQKARANDPDVSKADFMYPGPKPRTKEAAVVMLADSCEAAVRSLDDKSSENVSEMVNKIISGRISDGQLSESTLTFTDLESIASTFVTMFDGYFHQRIKYDDQEK